MKKEFLTTFQAANICNVTRFTIRNWIIDGKLKSNTTVGGHRRIWKKDLIRFVREMNIADISLKDAKLLIPTCWEFRKFKNSKDHKCSKCLVFKEKANKCFLFTKEFGSEKVECQHNCSACEYLAQYYPKQLKVVKAKEEKKRSPKAKRQKSGNAVNISSGNDIPGGLVIKKSKQVKGISGKGSFQSRKYLASVKDRVVKKKK